ncbi:potassium channel family protein [Methylomonas sp. MK1]|uniref:potassium channel family protein n=1 Tax=Methylomonas sp. MK1 TaxID=1131552 RepID=UPI00035CC6E6|nr:potassium channel family protein [Methylomonas sp. MK1]
MSGISDFYQALHWANHLRADLFKSKHLGYLMLLALAATLTVGMLLFLIDVNIHSPLDGIWSAWVTMTHVGYGDVVPVSFLGRVLAAGLILLGMVLFSLFTALVSVTLIGRNKDILGSLPLGREAESNRLQGSHELILDELAQLQLRMEVLQKLLVNNAGHTKTASRTIGEAIEESV